MRRLLHAGQQRGQQVGLLVDQVGAVVVGQLVLVGHRQRPGRARLDAQPAQDAAQVVDLVDAAVALAGAEALSVGPVGVGRALDVDRVGRAGPGAQLAADALLQPVGPAVELVPAVEARRGGHLLEGVLLGDDLLEHRPEGDPEAGDRVPELLLEGLAPEVGQPSTAPPSSRRRGGLSGRRRRCWTPSPAAAGGDRTSSGAAAPRTAPPAGIGGTGKPPALTGSAVVSGASSACSASSPKKNIARNSTASTPRPISRYLRSIGPRGRSCGWSRPPRSRPARSGSAASSRTP